MRIRKVLLKIHDKTNPPTQWGSGVLVAEEGKCPLLTKVKG